MERRRLLSRAARSARRITLELARRTRRRLVMEAQTNHRMGVLPSSAGRNKRAMHVSPSAGGRQR